MSEKSSIFAAVLGYTKVTLQNKVLMNRKEGVASLARHPTDFGERSGASESSVYYRLQLQQQPYRGKHSDLWSDGDIAVVRKGCRWSDSSWCAGDDRQQCRIEDDDWGGKDKGYAVDAELHPHVASNAIAWRLYGLSRVAQRCADQLHDPCGTI